MGYYPSSVTYGGATYTWVDAGSSHQVVLAPAISYTIKFYLSSYYVGNYKYTVTAYATVSASQTVKATSGTSNGRIYISTSGGTISVDMNLKTSGTTGSVSYQQTISNGGSCSISVYEISAGYGSAAAFNTIFYNKSAATYHIPPVRKLYYNK